MTEIESDDRVKRKIKSKVQGTISQQKITIDLMEMGYEVALFPSDNCPIDLVAHHLDLPGNNLVRLQVKTPKEAVSGIYCPVVKIDWRAQLKHRRNNPKNVHYRVEYGDIVDYMAYPWKGIGIYIPAEYVKENGQTQLTVPTKQFCLFRELKPEHRIEAEEYEYEDTNHKQTEIFY